MGAFIPNRAKQATIPFHIDPTKSKDENSGSVTNFTFVPFSAGGAAQTRGTGYTKDSEEQTHRILGIYPDSFEIAIQEDISFKHLYPINCNGGKEAASITFSTILNHIPRITIREYIPDPRIDSALNFMAKFYSIIAGIFEKSKDRRRDSDGKAIEPDSGTAKKLFGKIENFAKWAFDYLTTGEQQNGGTTIWDDLVTDKGEYGNAQKLALDSPKRQAAIFHFPFTLYYLFQSSTTTNTYEFPLVTNDNRIYSSTGHEGWTTGSNEFSITGLLGKIPIAGSLLKSTLGNISVNYLPWWDAEAGRKTAEPEIQVKFHLFNDNLSKAITNFICVNTFIANNRWIQYKLFQHSSSLYEIKLDGGNRLFACTCNATVRGIGNFRTPPENFANLMKKHCEGLVKDANGFTRNLISEHIVKIPDVYEVELNFKSILPANFNNFIFQYSAKNIDLKTGRFEEKVTDSFSKVVDKFKTQAIAEYQKSFSGGGGGGGGGIAPKG